MKTAKYGHLPADLKARVAEDLEALRTLNDEASLAAKQALHPFAPRAKARTIGVGPSLDGRDSNRADEPTERVKRHPFIKATLKKADLPAGALITAIYLSRSHDMDDQVRGKAMLRDMGIREVESGPDVAGYGGFIGSPEYTSGAIGKATLGASNANGGYVLPNNLVDDVLKPEIGEAVFSNLCTFVDGVNVRGVDQPFRTGAPLPATVIDWGSQKTLTDEVYGSYTATLGTFAKIFDIGKQYLRFSAGAAERDVLDELAKSFSLAERKAILAGPGTGSATPGVNDPTLGVYTALAADSPTFTTTFAGASASTILGSAATGIAKGIKALTSRGQSPTGIVMDASTYWDLWTEGSDAAGYFAAGAAMGGARAFSVLANGQLALWGVPIFWDNYFDTWTSTTKAAIVGNWRKLKVYRGMEFRVDSTDVAGSRWDLNLVGYRGEEELGVNAHTAVATGAFQLVTAILP